MDNQYYVKLDAFEGPLDLLLHLIKKHEIDIYNIPVAEITKQYTDFIEKMKEFELNIASEYLVMAATLLALKSKMLLPNQIMEEEENNTYIDDPREELIQQLLAYKKFKEVAKTLKRKETDDEQTFMRIPIQAVDKKLPQEPQASVQDMIEAFKKMLIRKEWNKPLHTKIENIEIPIEQRMKEIILHLQEVGSYLLFEQLYVVPSRSHIIATFIAMLELLNKNIILCEQTDHFDSLYIFLNKNKQGYGG